MDLLLAQDCLFRQSWRKERDRGVLGMRSPAIVHLLWGERTLFGGDGGGCLVGLVR